MPENYELVSSIVGIISILVILGIFASVAAFIVWVAIRVFKLADRYLDNRDRDRDDRD